MLGRSAKNTMLTHFPKMRRYIRITSILTPVLSFIAFIIYASGSEGLALCIGLIAFICGCAFPHQKLTEEPTTKIQWNILNIIPMIFFTVWLVSLDSFRALIDEFYSSSAMWDWRLITAIFIWHAHWTYQRFNSASDLTDEEIIDIYDSNTNKPIKMQNKSQ
jgi:hypothetical protein